MTGDNNASKTLEALLLKDSFYSRKIIFPVALNCQPTDVRAPLWRAILSASHP